MCKTLTQTLLAAFCAILAAVALSSAVSCRKGGGVMVAGHHSLMGAGGALSPRSYIQNGLIGMWDGEWNAGASVHNGNSTQWKDLSGNAYDLTLFNSNNTFSWGDKCAVFVRSGNYPYFQSTSETILTGVSAVTFEFYADLSHSDYFGDVAAFRKVNDNNRLLWYRQTNGRIDPVVSTVASGTHHLTSTSPYDYTNTRSETITVDQDGSIVFFINGLPFSTSSVSDFQTIASMGSKLGVNYEGSWTPTPIFGTWSLYNLRIYNRALSDVEVAKNFTVDTKRFAEDT